MADDDVAGAPLAARMRPRSLDDYVGQEHIVGAGKILRRLHRGRSAAIDHPLGTARRRQDHPRAHHRLADSQPTSSRSRPSRAGVADLRRVVAEARERGQGTVHPAPANPMPGARPEFKGHLGKRTILFIDEIHRFNKAQQDAVCPTSKTARSP